MNMSKVNLTCELDGAVIERLLELSRQVDFGRRDARVVLYEMSDYLAYSYNAALAQVTPSKVKRILWKRLKRWLLREGHMTVKQAVITIVGWGLAFVVMAYATVITLKMIMP